VDDGEKISPPERRALILLALLVREGAGAFQNELKPQPDRVDRDALVHDGLITYEKRDRRIWIEVTDKGWEWCSRNLGAALPQSSIAASQVLQAWMTRLKTFMAARDLALADILAPQPPAEAKPSEAKPIETKFSEAKSPEAKSPVAKSFATNSADVQSSDYSTVHKRIRRAYLELTGNRLNTRALLSDVRGKLKDIDRATLDQALKQMQQDHEASLFQLDNRREITDDDRAAAVYVGQEPRHILWIER
jgi:DNA-binding PadR family transcriptional regulator